MLWATHLNQAPWNDSRYYGCYGIGRSIIDNVQPCHWTSSNLSHTQMMLPRIRALSPSRVLLPPMITSHCYRHFCTVVSAHVNGASIWSAKSTYPYYANHVGNPSVGYKVFDNVVIALLWLLEHATPITRKDKSPAIIFCVI